MVLVGETHLLWWFWTFHLFGIDHDIWTFCLFASDFSQIFLSVRFFSTFCFPAFRVPCGILHLSGRTATGKHISCSSVGVITQRSVVKKLYIVRIQNRRPMKRQTHTTWGADMQNNRITFLCTHAQTVEHTEVDVCLAIVRHSYIHSIWNASTIVQHSSSIVT